MLVGEEVDNSTRWGLFRIKSDTKESAAGWCKSCSRQIGRMLGKEGARATGLNFQVKVELPLLILKHAPCSTMSWTDFRLRQTRTPAGRPGSSRRRIAV